MASSAPNSKFLLAVVHEFLLRKDRNLASVFKSKCSSVSHLLPQFRWSIDARG